MTISSVPKPPKRARARRAYNSTLAAPSKPAVCKRSLKSPKKLERSPRKPIAKRNAKRQAKRRISYAKGLAAYRKSETAKIVKVRAGGRCEAILIIRHGFPLFIPTEIIPQTRAIKLRKGDYACRCWQREKLGDHHLTYVRFGGDELPEDICRCCERCHAWFENQHPTRKRS